MRQRWEEDHRRQEACKNRMKSSAYQPDREEGGMERGKERERDRGREGRRRGTSQVDSEKQNIDLISGNVFKLRSCKRCYFCICDILGCSYLQFKRTKKKILSQPNSSLQRGKAQCLALRVVMETLGEF